MYNVLQANLRQSFWRYSLKMYPIFHKMDPFLWQSRLKRDLIVSFLFLNPPFRLIKQTFLCVWWRAFQFDYWSLIEGEPASTQQLWRGFSNWINSNRLVDENSDGFQLSLMLFSIGCAYLRAQSTNHPILNKVFNVFYWVQVHKFEPNNNSIELDIDNS